MEDVKVLKEVRLFAGLDNMEILEVGKKIHTLKVKAGEFVIRQGEIGGSFYVIKKGTVTVVLTANEEDKFLGRFLPGDSFGEIALIDNGPRSAGVRAETDVELLEIRQNDFQELIHRGDSISHKLMERFLLDLCDKIRRTNNYLLLNGLL